MKHTIKSRENEEMLQRIRTEEIRGQGKEKIRKGNGKGRKTRKINKVKVKIMEWDGNGKEWDGKNT